MVAYNDTNQYEEYAVNNDYQYLRFSAFVDPNYTNNSFKISVYADDVLIYESGWLTYKSDVELVEINIKKCKLLTLKTTTSEFDGWGEYIILGDATLYN